MKISAWLTVSDIVPSKRTKFEKVVEVFLPVERKHMYQSQLPEKTFSSLKKAGVTSVELLVPILTTDADIEKARKILKSSKIPVASIHQSLSSINKISFTEIERLCKVARSFSARVVVLHSSSLNKKLFDKKEIEKLLELQKKYDITFGVENMPKNPFNLRKKYTWKGDLFSNLITKNNLSITLDTTHIGQVGEDICEFFIKNKDRIVNIHLSDYKKSWQNKKLLLQSKTHLPLTTGTLPIKKFLQLLKKERYDGLITMEINADLPGLCQSARIIREGLSS